MSQDRFNQVFCSQIALFCMRGGKGDFFMSIPEPVILTAETHTPPGDLVFLYFSFSLFIGLLTNIPSIVTHTHTGRKQKKRKSEGGESLILEPRKPYVESCTFGSSIASANEKPCKKTKNPKAKQKPSSGSTHCPRNSTPNGSFKCVDWPRETSTEGDCDFFTIILLHRTWISNSLVSPL